MVWLTYRKGVRARRWHARPAGCSRQEEEVPSGRAQCWSERILSCVQVEDSYAVPPPPPVKRFLPGAKNQAGLTRHAVPKAALKRPHSKRFARH